MEQENLNEQKNKVLNIAVVMPQFLDMNGLLITAGCVLFNPDF